MTEKTKEKTKLETKPEKKETIWTSEEKQNSKTLYGCEILVENGTTDQVTTKQFPSDAYIIEYTHNDRICYDLTRGTKITLFDMYWDKMKGNLKSIDYGNGSIKPNLWGYQAPAGKKKKRKG